MKTDREVMRGLKDSVHAFNEKKFGELNPSDSRMTNFNHDIIKDHDLNFADEIDQIAKESVYRYKDQTRDNGLHDEKKSMSVEDLKAKKINLIQGASYKTFSK